MRYFSVRPKIFTNSLDLSGRHLQSFNIILLSNMWSLFLCGRLRFFSEVQEVIG